MIMSPGVRKFALATHLTVSVGWMGAVAAYIALDVTTAIGQEAATLQAAYLSMESIARYVIVPLAFASLVTGLVMSLGTKWGLFRHYWVVFKLAINVVSTVVLLLYTETFGVMAAAARDPAVDLAVVRTASPLVHAVAALALLLAATVLAVVKPPGLTPLGRRRLARSYVA
jgi:hypothetical protein